MLSVTLKPEFFLRSNLEPFKLKLQAFSSIGSSVISVAYSRDMKVKTNATLA